MYRRLSHVDLSRQARRRWVAGLRTIGISQGRNAFDRQASTMAS
ncbi:hypothetical protein [Synechococcus sp. RS9916]|nr:hypothetical protein [Synechococcus sp. RS9916]